MSEQSCTKPTPTVCLKNGVEEATPLVVVTMMVLNRLMDEGKARVVYELIELCKDLEHQPFGKTGEDLKEAELASQCTDGTWEVDGSTRNIVLSAVEGEGLDLRLVNPVAEGGGR